MEIIDPDDPVHDVVERSIGADCRGGRKLKEDGVLKGVKPQEAVGRVA